MKNKRHLIQRFLIASVAATVWLSVFSQAESDSSVVRYGGSYDDSQIFIDKATLGVHYQVTQKVKGGNELRDISDTLLLAMSNTHSIFLDPYFKENMLKTYKMRMQRTRKARNGADPTHESLQDIMEMRNAGSNYVEDHVGFPIQIYKDHASQMVTSINNLDENYECVQKIDEFQHWEISDETATIFNYSCKKAEVDYGGRHYTAWFTMDIPISEGPWKFYGLPGLILKVEDDEGLFRYEAIGLQQYGENVEIIKQKDVYEECNLKQFNTAVNKLMSKIPVSFYYDDILYFTYITLPYAFIPMEK